MTKHSVEIPVDRDESLHLRPMQMLVERAADFQSDLVVHRGGKQADAKSILDVMMLAAEKGPLVVQARGADAEKALAALAALLNEELSKD
jgi:phosphocarrier protein